VAFSALSFAANSLLFCLEPQESGRVLRKIERKPAQNRGCQMDSAQFRLPVRVRGTDENAIREIYSAEEALDLLLAWPEPKGRVYNAALKACFAASVEVQSTEEAQQAFAKFARMTGLLSPDMMPLAHTRAGHARSHRF
jgi:hypothetical protein